MDASIAYRCEIDLSPGGRTRPHMRAAGCTVTAQSTCTPGGNFHGLCVQPPAAASFGGPCESAPCPRCGTVRLGANDATIGNSRFLLWMNYGPRGGLAEAPAKEVSRRHFDGGIVVVVPEET